MEFTDENVPTSCRVKLYQLESEGNWLDQGTGFVSCSPLQSTEGPSMTICREDDDVVLLQSKIVLDDVYERQGESIIMWRETGLGWGQEVDYAISFQDSSGCFSVWEYICFVREHFHTGDEAYLEEQSLMLDQEGGVLQRSHRLISFEMPDVSPETLPDLVDIFTACSTNSQQKRMAAQYIVGHRYNLISRLVALCAELATKEDFAACGRVSDIMKQIAYLNDTDIIKYLVSDDIFLEVAGVWEYDATLRQKECYKSFLSSSKAQPKLALSSQPFSDGEETVVYLSLQLFRLKYLKDVMLRPLIDEGGAGALGNLIHATTTELCERLFSDHVYMNALMSTILSSEEKAVDKTEEKADEQGNPDEMVEEASLSRQPTESSEKSTSDVPLRRGGSGVSMSTLSTVSGTPDSLTPSPITVNNSAETRHASTSPDKEDHSTNGDRTPKPASEPATGRTESATHVHPAGVHSASDGSPSLSRAMQRMMIAVSSANPSDSLSATPNTRGACLRFLRELFGLSRGLPFEKRAELYSCFLEDCKDVFFTAMLSVLRCGPNIEWIISLNHSDNTSDSPVHNGANNGDKMENDEAGHRTAVDSDQFDVEDEIRSRETFHRLCAADILSTVTCVIPNALRSYILEGPAPKPILQGCLFGGMGVVRDDNCSDMVPYPIREALSHRLFGADKLSSLQSLRRHNSKCILYVLIARLFIETNEMVIEHIGDILRSVLDAECRTDSVADRERFAVAVHDSYLPWMVTCFLEPYRDKKDKNGGMPSIVPSSAPVLTPYLNSAVFYSSMRVVTETLCFCCTALGYRFKYFIIRNQLINKSLSLLLSCGQKAVYLHAVKFIFAIVKMRDEMNFKQWVKLDLLKPMFELMVSLSSRDNLLLSAIIELIDFIRVEGITILIEYIVEKHSQCFANVVYQGETFEKLSIKYAQIKDAQNDMAGGGQVAANFPQSLRDSVESTRKMKYTIQDAEESYFENDEEDNTISVRMSDNGTMDPLSMLRSYSDEDEIGPMPITNQSEPPPASAALSEDSGLSLDMFGDNDDELVGGGKDVEGRKQAKNLKKRRLSSIGGHSGSDRPDKLRILSSDSDNSSGGSVSASPVVNSDGNAQEDSYSGLSDEPPPLPPLKSHYDSSDDEEEGNGGKNFLDTLFKRSSSVSSSSSSSSGKESNKESSESTSKPGGLFSFSLKKKTKYFS